MLPTSKAHKDVVKNGASVGIELFEVFVFARSRLCFHRFKVHVMIDKALETDILTTEPWQFSQLRTTSDVSLFLKLKLEFGTLLQTASKSVNYYKVHYHSH